MSVNLRVLSTNQLIKLDRAQTFQFGLRYAIFLDSQIRELDRNLWVVAPRVERERFEKGVFGENPASKDGVFEGCCIPQHVGRVNKQMKDTSTAPPQDDRSTVI